MSRNSKEKPIGIILGHILDVLLCIVTILIIIGGYYLVQIKVLGDDYANLFGYTFFEVATGSMSNTIEIGDVVIVKITKEVNKGEIIVYRDEDNFVTHRLIEKDGNKLVAKGDANNSEDKIIKKDKVIGKVVKVIPKLGIIKNIIITPKIMISFLIFIFLLNLSLSYKPNKEEKKDD